VILEVGPGECVGEMSIIDGEPTAAEVVAAEPSEVVVIPEERVWTELIPNPGFARGLLQLLTRRLRRAAHGQAAYEQLRRELLVAREIQSAMLPPGSGLFADRPDVAWAAFMDPAAEVGGDFYDAFLLDDRHLFLAVGDVAGEVLAEGNDSGHFLALVAAILDLVSGVLRVANGGFGAPLVRRAGHWEPLPMPELGPRYLP
jgi:Cyclic nucleotide-binding domain